MPLAVIAAGAIGSVASAAISSHAANNATKAQVTATAANNTLAREQYATNAGNLNPAITRGNQAAGYVGDLLGVGGDPAKAAAAFQQYQGSTGYQYQLNEGLGAVNSNAYARGMGDSGATLKALQDRGTSIAQGSFQGYLGNLQNISQQGTGAASALAGVGQNMVGQVSGNNQALADATGNAALTKANGFSGAIGNLINAGAYASSYGSKNGAPPPQTGQGPNFNAGLGYPQQPFPYAVPPTYRQPPYYGG